MKRIVPLLRFFPNPSLAAGLFLTGGFLLMALGAFFVDSSRYTRVNVKNRFQDISLDFLLGTDSYGRDLFSMLAVGAQNTFALALLSVLLGMAAGVPLGLAASCRGKSWDAFIGGGSDFVFAFPAVLTAILLTAVNGPGGQNAILAIGIFNIPVFARVTRNGSLSLWRRDYVMAARLMGKGGFAIALQHILPNLLHLIVVQATIQFAMAILAESGLSYLGLSVQPPTPTWGKMLFDAQTFFRIKPMLVIYPGLAISLSVLGLNLLGDGLRDWLDPKLNQRRA